MTVSLRVASVACAVVGALLYLNTLDCGLCFDDETALIKNKDLRAVSPWSNLIWNDFWGTPMSSVDSHKSYRPLCVATFRLNYLLHELQPMGYHLVNVLLHSAVCYLYVQLCGVLFSEVWPALIAGLLFAVHPIHTEAVAGIVGRADIMATLFFLACLLVYRKAVLHRDRLQGGWCYLAASLLLCLCSALSKEQGITAIAVCLLYDCFILQQMNIETAMALWRVPLKRKPRSAATVCMLKRAAVLCLFSGCFMLIRLSLMKEHPNIPVTLNPAMILPVPFKQLHWSYLSVFNLWLLLIPSRLCAEYAMGTIPLITSVGDPRNLATLATFIGLGCLCYHAMKGTIKIHKNIAFGAAVMLIAYLPASNLLFPVGFVVAERILYMPSIGFCIIVANGIYYLATRPHSHVMVQVAVKVAAVYLLIVHSAKTLQRNRDWLSEKTLYHSAVHVFPSNGKMLHNLAADYASKQDFSTAEKLLQAAVSTEPNYINAFSDLGAVLVRREKLAQAEEAYRTAVRLIETGLRGDRSIPVAIKNINTYTRLSKLLKQNSTRLREAYQLCQAAVRIFPNGYGIVYAEIGDILLRMNRSSEAVLYLENAVGLQSTQPDVYQNLADVHIEMGRSSEAETVLRSGLKAIGKYPPLMVKLAFVLHLQYQLHKDSRKVKEAEELLLYSIAADPTNADTLYTLGLVYYSTGTQDEKAAKLFKLALQYSPAHQEALLHLSKASYRTKRFRQCSETLERLFEVAPNHIEGRKLLRKCT